MPVFKTDCLGVLTCYTKVNSQPALTVIDTASGISLINLLFVQKHKLSTYEWESPSIAPIQGRSFTITRACSVSIKLLSLTIVEECGILDAFMFDLLLGIPYLRQTPFLIDCRNASICNPVNSQTTTLCLVTSLTAGSTLLALQGPEPSTELPTLPAVTSAEGIHIAEFSEDIGEEDERMIPYPSYDIRSPYLSNEVSSETWDSLDISSIVTADEKHKFITLLKMFSSCSPTGKHPIGECSVYEHHIDTGDHKPISQPLRRFGFQQRSEITKQINIMLSSNVIAPSYDIEWSSNLHLV